MATATKAAAKAASKPKGSTAKVEPPAPEKVEVTVAATEPEKVEVVPAEPKAKGPGKADVVDFIVKNPTASDQAVAAEVGVTTDFAQTVRDDMGARHTWPEPKEA